jgi:hypothetical protein
MRSPALMVALLCIAVAAAGCGSSGHTAAQSTSTAATSAFPSRPGALQAEANSAAAGDIPDNQVFLVFRNDRAGYSMKYPEGWAQRGSGRSVVFRDRNNIVRIAVAAGGAPSKASVEQELRSQKGVRVVEAPRVISFSGKPLLKAVYSTESAPNAVTGKRVTLVVDRYYLWKAGRRAIVDLGTPQGVDNVDAYRLMIESFRWR